MCCKIEGILLGLFSLKSNIKKKFKPGSEKVAGFWCLQTTGLGIGVS